MVSPSFTKLFQPTQLTAAAATLFTMPTTATAFLGNGRVRFTNTDTAAHKVTAYVVPAGATAVAGAGNCFMNAENVAANAHMDIDLPQMGPGDFFQAFADTTAMVTCHCTLGTVLS